MIVPMKKISLVVMNKSREVSLEKLREIGVVHLEKRNVSSAALSILLEQKSRSETALGVLQSYAAKGKGSANYAAEKSGLSKGPQELVERVLSLSEEKKSLFEQLAWNTRERSRIEKWGDFDPRLLAELAEKGVTLIPYELSHRVYEALESGGRIILLGKDKAAVYCVALDPLPGETPWLLPERSLSGLAEAAGNIQSRLAEIETEFKALAPQGEAAARYLKILASDIEFEIARAGMDLLEEAPVELTVSWITGYIPRDDLGLLKRAAAENGWAFVACDPGPEDPVPTKLKNNKLASLIYPLTDFLEVVPGYNEVDISGWFLFFFVIFFGMIFGDAGYGALLLLIGVIGALKTSRKGVPQGLKLLLLLGFSNFAWGVLTCTWFGIDAAVLPAFFGALSLPLISNATAAQSAGAKAIVDQNLQIFCFSLALLQLSIAHIKGIIRNIRSLKVFGELGSLAMLIGMYNVVLALVVSNSFRRIPFLPASLYLIAGGFALSFVFAGYEGSVVKSIVNSLKNIISVILGITNVFSDIMSYIRLWAVGLAGASISATVNAMAGPLLGNFLIFLGIILLVFGHGLNLILNVLSVLVHGVRLNTLEFSGHLGLTWAGVAYKPFAKTDIK
ncbi:MAG: V-type ATP synthase subunit I [Treponema sp.]|jgi:V/A-type H+-transporting ATPase subunit I|nr:V-type ATP synthase subunit I [Treponema sp.]